MARPDFLSAGSLTDEPPGCGPGSAGGRRKS